MKIISLETALASLTRLPGIVIGPDVTCAPGTIANVLSGSVRIVAPDELDSLEQGQHFRPAIDALATKLQDRLPRLTDEICERLRELKPSLDLPYLAKAGWSACISLTDDVLFESALRNHFDSIPTSLSATIIDGPSLVPPERTVPIYKLLGNLNNRDPAHTLAMSESALLVRQQTWPRMLRTFPDYLREGPLFLLGTASVAPLVKIVLGTLLGMGRPNVSKLVFLKDDPTLRDSTILALCNQFETATVDANLRDVCAAIAELKPQKSYVSAEAPKTISKLQQILKMHEDILSSVPSSIPESTKSGLHLPALIDGLFRPAAIDWHPFIMGLDLRRTITDQLKHSITASLEDSSTGRLDPVVARGEAGIGKTILLKRTAVELAADGFVVLWCRRSTGPGWVRNFRNLAGELAEYFKSVSNHQGVVVFCDDPWALRMDASELMGCFDRFPFRIAFVFALRNSDFFSWEHSTLPLGSGATSDHEIPFELDDREWKDLGVMLQKIGAVKDQAEADREMSLVPRRNASDILCSLWYLIPETRSQLSDSLRDEYCRLGNVPESLASAAQAIAADSDTARRAYEYVTVTSNLDIGLPIEVLVRALAINYDDWMEMIVDGRPLWGLLYDEQDSESGNILFRTRNEIVTRVLLDLVNGGVGHVGEYRVLCDLLRACDGGSAVYRNFILELLVRNRSRLQKILSYEQGIELFDIAQNALIYEDRLLEHHKGIWIDDVGRDTKAAYSQLEKALHTEVYPSAERDAPLEHIHTSMASSIVKMVKSGQQDRTIGFQLVRDHLRQASSPTFFNAHTAHVSANLLFQLSQQSGKSTPDGIALASIGDALQEIERAFQLIGTHGRNHFRDEKSIAMLTDLQSKIIRSIPDLDSLKALAQRMFDETGSQLGFEVVARRLLVEASEGNKGHAYNGVNEYISECVAQIEDRGTRLSTELVVIRIDLIVRWRIQRFLSVQWENFTHDLKSILENVRYRDDAIKRFYYAVGLFHLKHVTEANAVFAGLRRLQLSASPREIRCYYLGDQGDARRVQGTVQRKHNYSYVLVTDLQLSVPMRSPTAGGGTGSVVHAYIAFSLNGPTAVLDKPGPSDIGLP
ncbi:MULTISPECIES: hypothetical protein [Burkholderia]|uniref:P-loop NTPase n=1 Tax=Burkholderia TaxID=32008 RepID=UPI00158D2816|nr:hypothetical protein [Burkholderia ambifaria]